MYVRYLNGLRKLAHEPRPLTPPFDFLRKVATAHGRTIRPMMPNGIRLVIQPAKVR